MMNSMMRLHLRKMQRLFTVLRWAEAAAIVLFALRGAPSLARASGDFLRISVSVLLGPRFLFLLGNAIVILLFFNKNTSASNGTTDDGTTTSTTTSIISSFVPPPVLLLPEEAAREGDQEEEVVFEDKEVVVLSTSKDQNKYSSTTTTSHVLGRGNYRRSRSEKIDVDRRRKGSPEPEPEPKLRRSKTEVEKEGEGDAEEFRRTIEAFIEKQLKFQRQESMSTSAYNINSDFLAIVSLQEEEEDGSLLVKEKY
ncbi:putative GPI-anchored protein 58 [Iris pallida]|uniref:GPI-anchored protein 58 n=1 Tax=Iris pallida TaxID=29817 RepID=A0AAX6EH31_IRIPA|nr:putative GPI-anchored protein 58 [Iris pallida]